MLKDTLNKIGNNLTNGRAKVIFGPLGKKESEEIFSYFKKLITRVYPDIEIYEGEAISQLKSFNTKQASTKRCCLLIDDIFAQDDFTVMINQAYGSKNVIIIGISHFDDKALDYGKMTLIAGRYESYYLSPASFSLALPNIDFVNYLSKGKMLFSKEDYLSESLTKIENELKTRRSGALRNLYDFIVKKAGKAWSIRELSSCLPISLSPNTISRYLEAFVDNFLLYKLEGFDLTKMKPVGNNFRLYPYDTSLYSYTLREVASSIDLLSLTPLISRLKEEGYECYFGYMYKQKLQPDNSRKYVYEDVGIYANNGQRQLLFALNISGSHDFKANMLRLSPTIEKYIVENGNGEKEFDNHDLCHIGIEYLLGDNFN